MCGFSALAFQSKVVKATAPGQIKGGHNTISKINLKYGIFNKKIKIYKISKYLKVYKCYKASDNE